MKNTLPILALLAASMPAMAQTGPLAVSAAWARATPPQATSAVIYLTVTDTGAADRLTGASTDVADMAMLHESRSVGGVMQMRDVAGLDISAGHPITLAPGGYHLMLTGLKAPLKAGEHFPLTLVFEKVGAVAVTVTVQSIAAAAPGEMKMDMPGMSMGNGG